MAATHTPGRTALTVGLTLLITVTQFLPAFGGCLGAVPGFACCCRQDDSHSGDTGEQRPEQPATACCCCADAPRPPEPEERPALPDGVGVPPHHCNCLAQAPVDQFPANSRPAGVQADSAQLLSPGFGYTPPTRAELEAGTHYGLGDWPDPVPLHVRNCRWLI